MSRCRVDVGVRYAGIGVSPSASLADNSEFVFSFLNRGIVLSKDLVVVRGLHSLCRR